jgi:hypothetical protein
MSPTLVLRGTVFPKHVSSDGRFLFYNRRGEKTRLDIWALPLAGEHPAPARIIAADGKRFLIGTLLGDANATSTTVVLNWLAELSN